MLLFKDIPTSEMIFVKGTGQDTFMMGDDHGEYDDEKPAHPVFLPDFWIGKYPVTQAVWKRVMNGDNPSYFRGDERPVKQVSWNDIVGVEKEKGFLHFLNDNKNLNEKIIKLGKLKLPSEAEWEYAARGGMQWKDNLKYAGSAHLDEVGWYNDNSHEETKSVGLKAPNQLGIFDMSGNVREWCADWYSNTYYQECFEKEIITEPTGPTEGSLRVLRGGSWHYSAHYCRVTYRDYGDPRYRNHHFGFRLVLSLQ